MKLPRGKLPGAPFPSGRLLALLCIYLALALAYGVATPDLEAPDAGGHWQYVAYLHEHRALPAFTTRPRPSPMSWCSSRRSITR